MPNPIHDELPLTESTFFILLALVRGPRHGYAILKDVTDLSEGRVGLSTGTLYGALDRLLKQGWIERLETDEEEENGRKRKDYFLTHKGRVILIAEMERMNTVLAVARHRLAGGNA
jgi:DNA-binding PadR family transcriptional regulator